MAGYPKRCPHGEPIPTADGVMPRVTDRPLNVADTGQEYVASRVNSHDESMLKYLDELGLKTGVKLTLLGRAPFNGPLQIKIGDVTHHIGYELAGIIRVCLEEEFELQYD